MPDPGPRHVASTAQLDEVISAAARPVAVTIESDQHTEVSVYRVGSLGAFRERSLELRPGVYVVTGRREGYREVRHELVVRAGTPPPPLRVLCVERI